MTKEQREEWESALVRRGYVQDGCGVWWLGTRRVGTTDELVIRTAERLQALFGDVTP